MKSFWFCWAILLPGTELQRCIPCNPSTFCGSLFDIRYSAFSYVGVGARQGGGTGIRELLQEEAPMPPFCDL